MNSVTSTKPASYYKCPQCPHNTQWNFAALDHMNRHHIKNSFDSFTCSEDFKVYRCNVCVFDTLIRISLVQHQIRNHPFASSLENTKNSQIEGILKPKPLVVKFKEVGYEYSCPQCGLLTFSKVFLFMHMEKCKFVVYEKFSMKWFECLESAYKNFKRPVVETIEWFKCTDCPYKAKQKGTLKMHQMSIHFPKDKIKWFECAQCPFKAKTNANLKSHRIRKHPIEGEMPWLKCSQCSYKSRYKDDYKMHQIRQHTNKMKQLECTECSYKTIYRITMKRHQISKHGVVKNIK